ncbi:EH domain-containing protein 4 [Grus japonensis]|uniref:EH domain-containing protein 4 n=1 Tax=Grus japonensis TaxID=30415 RepID=A0ABC9WNB9_GRUJA
MARQAVPLQPVEVHGEAVIHLQPVEDPTLEQVEAPEGGCDAVGSLQWNKLVAGPVAPWREEPMLEQVCWQDLRPHGGPMLQLLFLKDCTSWKRLMLEQFMKNCSLWEGREGLTLEKLVEDCLPWEEPHAGAGEEWEESSP